MKKWNVRLSDEIITQVYKNTIGSVVKFCNTNFKPLIDREITKDDIILDEELKYMEYVNEIIDNSDGVVYIKNKKHYLYKSEMGLIPVNLWKDKGFYFDSLQYIDGVYDKESKSIKAFQGRYVIPMGWTVSEPKLFLDKFGIGRDIKFVEYSMRFYGDDKLSMPKELKGIKQWGSVDYIPKKCKCKVYVENDNVWIKHRDYFSSPMKIMDEDIGAPLSYLCKKYLDKNKSDKFVYPDAWGQLICRNEAWIKIENLMLFVRRDEDNSVILSRILRSMEKKLKFRDNELENSDMSRMFEKLIKDLKKCNKENILINN